jgi:hypothetical protein
MGCTRSIVGMRATSIYEEGTIKTGNCAHFRLDPVTPLEADGYLKIPIAPMELGLIFYLVHDVDAKRSAHNGWLMDSLRAKIRYCLSWTRFAISLVPLSEHNHTLLRRIIHALSYFTYLVSTVDTH